MPKQFRFVPLVWILSGLAVFLFSHLLVDGVQKTDLIPISSWVGIFLFVGLFLISALGWGEFVGRKIFSVIDFELKILIGILLAISLTWITGWVGFLGDKYQWLFGGIQLAGLGFLPKPNCPMLSLHVSRLKERSSFPQMISVAFALTFFLLCLRQATQFQLVEDVFSYHLLAPSHWWREGRMYFDSHYPHLFMASYWEALYLWAFVPFAESSNRIFFVLAFSQVLHVVLGLGGSMVFVYRILRNLDAKREWSVVAALYAASIYPLLWTAWHAKNDYGALLFGLGATLALFKKQIFWSGILVGVAIAVKISGAFALAALPFCYFLDASKRKNFIFVASRFLCGCILGMLPFLLRNFLETGNPVFPFLVETLSPGITSITLNEVIYSVLGESGNFGSKSLFVFIVQFIREPLLAFTLALLVFSWAKEKRVFVFAVSALLPVMLAALWLGHWLMDTIFVRYIAFSLCLGVALPFWGLNRFLRGKSSWVAWGCLCLSLVVWIFSKPYLPWQSLIDHRWSGKFYESYSQLVPGVQCKDWLEVHSKENSFLVSLEDDFLLGFPRKIRVAAHDPELDALVRNSTNGSFLAEFQRRGVEFVYQIRREDGRRFYEKSEIYFQNFLDYPARAFSGKDCVILRL